MTAEMVLAILEGRKTQTRRVIKPQPTNGQKHLYKTTYSAEGNQGEVYLSNQFLFGKGFENKIKSPYRIGDEVFVKEDFFYELHSRMTLDGWDEENILYYAEATDFPKDYKDHNCFSNLLPAAHMKKEQSRITLRISNISVERLQDISEDDAVAEGLEVCEYPTGGDDCEILWKYYGITEKEADGFPWFREDHASSFRSLWNSIYKKHPEKQWKSNPYVWKIEFEVVK